MNLDELRDELEALANVMDEAINSVTNAATEAQKEVYKAIIELINRFELIDGRFVANQNFGARFAALEKMIKQILGDIYAPSIGEYLNTFKTVEEVNVALQKSYNDLDVEVGLLRPARKSLYDQASHYLTKGLADAYVQPAKYLLMQQVTTGISLRDSLKILDKWHSGDLTKGEIASGRQTPNLQKYATQIARDTLYTYQGTIQSTISKRYDLEDFVYVGDVVSDSRKACKYFVGLRRIISLDEVPDVLKRFPEGVIPGTTRDNFLERRCGYSCRHNAMPVRKRG